MDKKCQIYRRTREDRLGRLQTMYVAWEGNVACNANAEGVPE